jgi:hypothetical protein
MQCQSVTLLNVRCRLLRLPDSDFCRTHQKEKIYYGSRSTKPAQCDKCGASGTRFPCSIDFPDMPYLNWHNGLCFCNNCLLIIEEIERTLRREKYFADVRRKKERRICREKTACAKIDILLDLLPRVLSHMVCQYMYPHFEQTAFIFHYVQGRKNRNLQVLNILQ